jgi:hypothetical protein
MAGTQITIPDHVYTQALRVARERGLSLEEFLEKAVEAAAEPISAKPEQAKEWKLPGPFNLGKPLLPEEEWDMASRDEL